jgi:hypothetical protein
VKVHLSGGLVLIAVLLPIPGASEDSTVPVRISAREAWEHLVSEPPVLHFDLPPRLAAELAMVGLEYQATVDENGNVRSVEITGKVMPRGAGLVREGRRLLLAALFRPFLRDGRAVSVVFDAAVQVLPVERTPARRLPFPEVRDWKTVRIALSRSGCFGTCPSYTVLITGDGAVAFEGRSHVAVNGHHSSRIGTEKVRELVAAFRDADYMSLDDKYEYPVTDNPTYETSISFDNVTKKVVDYVGLNAGMPEAVNKLEEEIDRVAGTARWVKGNEETVPSLVGEGFDFRSSLAAELMAAAVRDSNVALVRELVAQGTPLAAGVNKTEDVGWSVGRTGNLELMRLFLEAGLLEKQEQKDSALVGAAYSGRLDAVELMLTAGADPRARRADGKTALFGAIRQRDYEGRQDGVDAAAVVTRLIGAGADPNAADKDGMTPLMEAAWDPEVATALLANGANVNARAKKGGWTPLINCVNPEVARVLLEHGADVAIRDDRGMDALQAALKAQNKPKAELIEAWKKRR